MKIVLIHFHLNTGGVTSVIKDQVQALQGYGCDLHVLSGSPPVDAFPAPVSTIPELAYDADIHEIVDPQSVAENILKTIHQMWPQGADIIHVHNPTLAKNRSLQKVLKILQKNGPHLLCQIHDFAEDGRPGAYFPEPYLSDCHYAAINPRDHQLLLMAGLKPEGCHLLPNAVSPSFQNPDAMKPGGMVLYPVRAIRRKNIGEAVLLSLFFPGTDQLAITLPPNSPVDISSYHRWCDFVRRYQLPISFEVGSGRDFNSLMSGCHYVLTTSITEGFGFTFLEAWTAGKALWGRALPDICRGFELDGIRLDHLYQHLWIPLDWLEVAAMERQWKTTLQSAAKHLGLPLSPQAVAAGWNSLISNGNIDFSLLSEPFQLPIVRRLKIQPNDRQRLIVLNPYLANPGPSDISEALIAYNRSIIGQRFNLHRYSERLLDIYSQVMRIPVTHHIDKEKIASAFLVPWNFSLLKWGVPD